MLRNISAQLSNGPFVGIGDGIYNAADPRWTPPRRGLFGIPLPGTTVKPPFELTRLVGSAQEIQACAQKWAGDRPPVLLTGLQASREALASALRTRPAVIHLAAHVLQRSEKPDDALMIDLGLSPQAQPEVLTIDDVANFEVPGAMVVMNGCSSARAPAVFGKGVMGLTRAWIMAGAQTVIGSRWPIPDDTGELFQMFYANWKNNRGRATPRRIAAESLQRAQRAVLDANTWRSDPKYWSAFYVVGKE
jgi:CHAT domain-containing protein